MNQLLTHHNKMLKQGNLIHPQANVGCHREVDPLQRFKLCNDFFGFQIAIHKIVLKKVKKFYLNVDISY